MESLLKLWHWWMMIFILSSVIKVVTADTRGSTDQSFILDSWAYVHQFSLQPHKWQCIPSYLLQTHFWNTLGFNMAGNYSTAVVVTTIVTITWSTTMYPDYYTTVKMYFYIETTTHVIFAILFLLWHLFQYCRYIQSIYNQSNTKCFR